MSLPTFQTGGDRARYAFIEGYKPAQDLRDPSLFVSALQSKLTDAELRRRAAAARDAAAIEAEILRRQGGRGKITPRPPQRITPRELDRTFPWDGELRRV
jgi:hypothetical protein